MVPGWGLVLWCRGGVWCQGGGVMPGWGVWCQEGGECGARCQLWPGYTLFQGSPSIEKVNDYVCSNICLFVRLLAEVTGLIESG